MFPFDANDIMVDIEPEENTEPSDYEVNFNTGLLTGRIVTGVDAVKQRVMLVLSTDRYVFPQYSWDFGNEINELVGKGYNAEYMETEVQRMIEDALLPDEDIAGIEDFNCVIDGDKMTVSFRILTPYGDEEVVTDV